jgi:tetratricopeptide (TPR) repeat protein
MKRDYETAEEKFKESIEAKPKNINFLRNRAKCLFDQGKYDLATKDLVLANKLGEDSDPACLYELGLTHFHDGKYKKCL